MAQIGSLLANQPQKSKEWQKDQDDIERSRAKIANALKDAKERSKKNINLGDDIDTKFNQLQVFGIKLMDMLRESKLLFEGKHHQAVPAAIQSLKFSIDVHGLNSVNLVPSYLILAEANIGLGKLTQADEYLAQAEWTVMKSPDAKDSVRSKLFRNMGLLHAAKGDYDNALRMLSEDIYHASTEWNSNHIRTSGGYFHMANVFFRQNKMDIADSLYTQVVNIWYEYLCDAVDMKTAMEEEANAFGPVLAQTGPKRFLDQTQEAEAIQTLSAVLDMRDQSPKRQPAAISKICLTLAMLFYILDDINKAKDYGRKASQNKDQNESSDQQHSFLRLLDKRQ